MGVLRSTRAPSTKPNKKPQRGGKGGVAASGGVGSSPAAAVAEGTNTHMGSTIKQLTRMHITY